MTADVRGVSGAPKGVRPEGVRPKGGRPKGGRPKGGRPKSGRPKSGRPESGSAVVEFVFLAVLMLIPLIYLVMTLGRLQAGAYAASAAAREAGRAYTTAATEAEAEARADAAASIAFEDQGFRGNGRLSLSCDGTPCLRPEGRIEVTSVVTVPLPFVPSFARDVVPLEVPLTASHVAVVDRFRGAP